MTMKPGQKKRRIRRLPNQGANSGFSFKKSLSHSTLLSPALVFKRVEFL